MLEIEALKVEQSNKDKNEFVTTLVVNKEGKTFSFIRKENQKLDPGKKDLISGHIKNNGEVPIQAMYREIREETGLQQEDILKFYSLGEMPLPHLKLQNKICHVYCILIDYNQEQLSKSIEERAQEKEIERVEELENLQALIEDIKDETSNWRVYCSKEFEEKINMANELLNKGISADKEK